MRNFKTIASDIDFEIAEREIKGRMTPMRYKILSRYARVKSLKRGELYCGHEHDCCGCMCGQSMELIASHNSAKLVLAISFNY
jgi:hypothetical protein